LLLYGTTKVVPFPNYVAGGVLVPQGDFGEAVFVGVADYGSDAGEGGDFFGGALGVASGDENFGVGIVTLEAADGGARVLVGGVSDGAGVEDDEVSFVFLGGSEAARFELALEGGAIGLGGAASEVFHVEGGHGIS
jgi:hypothetical protein